MMNRKAFNAASQIIKLAELYRVNIHTLSDVTVIDCGCEVRGGIDVGLQLARITMSTLCNINIASGRVESQNFPSIEVQTDWPTLACLGSQYAGWPLNHNDYFAMVSGPIRILRQKEELLNRLNITDDSDCAVAILECAVLPASDVIDHIVNSIQIPRDEIILLVAPTTSLAGMIQVVSRSVETCLHKLDHLGFDTNCVISAMGSAPLPPISPDVMQSIGWSNDAILYASNVLLYVDTDDNSIKGIGGQVPTSSSSLYGKPFVEILKEAGDFYSIDPLLFSSAAVTINNLKTGSSFQYGRTDYERFAKIVRQL